jgi:SAM-dependent methyltransferase
MTVSADGKRSAVQYDAMAADYSADNDDGPCNSYYERPTTQMLIGNPSGLRVLDAGCGHGVLTNWLLGQGAAVVGTDVSAKMIDIARAGIGTRVELFVADLSQGLPQLADSSADLVVASLVMHYIEHWEPVFAEFNRILVPGGILVFSTHHPSMDWEHTPDNYFEKKSITETWTKRGHPYPVTFWRRPLSAITEAISTGGFVIERLLEPAPSDELRKRDERTYELVRTRPRYLFFRLRSEKQ